MAVTLAAPMWMTLAGCGFTGVPFAPVPVSTTPAEKLEGNWLIVGTMPRLDIPLAGPNQSPGLTISFRSIGGSLTGSAFLSGTCASGEPFGVIFGNALTAVPDAAGKFVTSSTQTFGWGFTLTGTAPNLSGEPWSGTYQLSNAGTNTTCAFSESGTFRATPVSQLTGTFSGSLPVLSFVGDGVGLPPGTPIAVKMMLTQGVTETVNDATTYDAQLAQGQIQISGTSCFTHGSTSPTFESRLLGNVLELNFSMDDGSMVTVFGTIDDVATTHLLLNTLLISGGSCSGTYEIAEPGGVLLR